MAKRQINYDNFNKQKESHKEAISNYEKALKEEKDKNAKLKAENKQLRTDLFNAQNGTGAIKSRDNKIKKLEKKVEVLKAELTKNDNPYYCFSEDRRCLIKKIMNLHYEGHIIVYNDILNKFRNGTEVLLDLSRKITKGKIVLRDIYIYSFRDSLICLLEKSLQAITNGMSNRGVTAILNTAINHYETYIVKIDKDLLDDVPLLKDVDTFKKLMKLVHVENTAFHGSVIDYRKSTAKVQTESNDETNDFLEYDSEKQLDILFTLIEFLYQIFTSKNKEMILLLIDKCWN